MRQTSRFVLFVDCCVRLCLILVTSLAGRQATSIVRRAKLELGETIGYW